MHLPSLACTIALLGFTPWVESGEAVKKPSVYTVRKHDTAARIARQHGLSLANLSALNPKINLSRLGVGTKLCLEKKGVTQAKASEPLAHALPPLPTIPALPPTSLARLTSVASIPLEPPQEPLAPSAVDANSSRTLAGHIQPVLPAQPQPAALPSAPDPLGFEAADPDHLDLLWPVETRTVSSGFGPRMRSTVRVVASKKGKKSRRIRVPYQGSHRGVDLNAPKGTDVFASMDGRVVEVGRQKQMGNFVVIDHGNGVETLYGHNSRNFVQVGDLVRRGQKIAEVGRTGRATGPHVHFELRIAGIRHNPAPFLNDVEAIPTDLLAQNDMAVPPSRR